MKGFLTLTIYALLAAPVAFANGESLTIREKAKGTAGVDEQYVDELKTRDAALQRKTQSQKTREKMESNPRNPAMVESFEGVSSDKDQSKEERKQEARKY